MSTALHKKRAAAQAEIRECDVEIAAVEAAPRSCEELRTFWRGKITHDIAVRQRVIAHELMLTGSGRPFSVPTPAVGQPLDVTPALVAVLGVDAMMAALEPFFASMPAGLGYAERKQRLAELHAKKLAAEHREMDAIEALESAGERVEYRSDADPAVVLRCAP